MFRARLWFPQLGFRLDPQAINRVARWASLAFLSLLPPVTSCLLVYPTILFHMLSSSLSTGLASLVLLLCANEVTPTPANVPPRAAGTSMSLTRRKPTAANEKDWGTWAKNQRDYLSVKYGSQSEHTKRSSGTNL
jgi:hypothetical protein